MQAPAHRIRPRRFVPVALFALILPVLASARPAAPAAAAPATGPGADAPRVAVLVHGFQGLIPWSRGHRCEDGLLAYDQVDAATGRSPRAAGEFGRLARDLEAGGYAVYFARWTTGGSRTEGLAASGRCLAAQIAEARRRAGAAAGREAAPVTLLGHSMGGLVGRAYLEGEAFGSRRDVGALVTFGAPHLGMASDSLLRLYAMLNPAAIPGGILPCAQNPGVCDLSVEAMRAFNAEQRRPEGLAYRLVAGDRGVIPMSWFISGADDGLVETASARGLNEPRHTVNDSHTDFSPLVTDHYVRSEESAGCLQAFLGLGSANRCGREPAARIPAGGTSLLSADLGTDLGADFGADFEAAAGFPAAGPAGASGADIMPPDPPQPAGLPESATPVRLARLEAGGIAELPVVLDGGRAVLVLGWRGAEPELHLVAPDGTRLRARAIGQALPASDYRRRRLAGGGLVWITLDQPDPGPWTVEVRAGDAGPSELGMVASIASPLSLAWETDLRPDGSSDRGTSRPILVLLIEDAEGIPGAMLRARWSAGGQVHELPLVDQGGGRYGAEIGPLDPGGWSHVVVTASGRDRWGRAFEREAGSMLAGTAPAPGPR